MRTSPSILRWIWLAVLLTLAALAAAFFLLSLGRLHDSQRNLVPQVLVGGTIMLLALGAYLLRFHPELLSPPPTRLGLVLLVLIGLALTGVYALYARPFLTLPYDLASWSEGFFITDIIKWRVGAKLYLPALDSNSSAYTPGAPAVTYFLAWLFRRSASIVFYRYLQQAYLGLAALFAAAAAWHLARLANSDTKLRRSRLWLVFFALASFLFATNRTTNAFNIFLHTDSMAVLAATLAFWLMLKHATTRNPRWLWAMAAMPSLAFLVKQNQAIWAIVYVIYLWLDGGYSWRYTLAFGAACLGVLAATLGACLAFWGQPFYYWVIQELSWEIVSFRQMFNRFADAAWCTLLGLLGGAVLLRGRAFSRLLGIWLGWLAMVLAGVYTAGIAYIPTHLGPATMIGGCFFLGALVTLWPEQRASREDWPYQWCQVGLCVLSVLAVFAGLGYPLKTMWSVPADLGRYVAAIEREFEGLPTERVLTDYGDWVYLRANVLMKDRAPILLSQHTSHYGLVDRLRRREYAKVLVRVLPRGGYSYELGRGRKIVDELLLGYREVRRIPGVSGVQEWLYGWMTMGDVAVFEPLPPAESSAKIPSHENDRATR